MSSKYIYLFIFSLLSFCQLLAAKPQLYKAILKDDHEKVQKLIQEHNEDVNQKVYKQMSPLFLACKQGNEKIVSSLITAGADINALSFKQYSPLMIAAKNGHHEVVKLLLAASPRLDHTTSLGLDPLMLAAQGNDLETVKHLLNVFPINGQDNQGNTPLIHCVLAGDNAEMLKLLKQIADVTIVNKRGYTAETLAKKKHRKRINEVFNPTPKEEEQKTVTK